jgi:hypothetical protein
MDVKEEIRATLARLQEMLDALQSGKFHIGARPRGAQKQR